MDRMDIDKIMDYNDLINVSDIVVGDNLIIPDGNRRWSIANNFSAAEGHKRGCDVVTNIVEAALDVEVAVITFYAFSTENWQRPQEEVDVLMGLLKLYLIEQTPLLIDKSVRLHALLNSFVVLGQDLSDPVVSF